MKTIRFRHYLIILAMFGLSVTSCKKDSNSPASTTFTNQQIAQVQNSDVQDAIAEKTDQDIDKSIDQLQTANFQPTALKDLSVSGSVVITIDHPDSTTFPKIVKIVFTNFQDSTADESFVKNGEVDILVTTGMTDKQLITWEQTFKNFSVTTDSTTFLLNGTRMVQRTGHTFKFNGQLGLRISTTDNITGTLAYAITKTGTTDTLKFTRVLSRVRNAILHYDNIGGPTWRTSRFRYNLSKDTVTWSGTVTGINEDAEPYSKTVSTATPLVITFYKGTPIISSGTLSYEIMGTSTSSYTITFMEDPVHPRQTLVTVLNNTTLVKYSFDRRFSRKFRKWW